MTFHWCHMGATASQITGNSNFCSAICSADKKDNTNCLIYWPCVSPTCRWSVDFPLRGPMMRKAFFHCGVIMSRSITFSRPDRELRYGPETGVEEYEEIPTENHASYDMTHHFLKAHGFIDHARRRGKVLIFCPEGDRSGTVAISYLMKQGYALLNAAKLARVSHRVKERCGWVTAVVIAGNSILVFISKSSHCNSFGSVRSWMCSCLVIWCCYHLTAAPSWLHPFEDRAWLCPSKPCWTTYPMGLLPDT